MKGQITLSKDTPMFLCSGMSLLATNVTLPSGTEVELQRREQMKHEDSLKQAMCLNYQGTEVWMLRSDL